MEILWHPNPVYRSFVDYEAKHLSIVTDHLVNQACVVGDAVRVTITVDLSDRFCDLEIGAEAFWVEGSLTIPPHISTGGQLIRCVVEPEDAWVTADLNLDYVLIEFTKSNTGEWMRLGGEDVWLRVAGRVLEAVFIGSVIHDPGGLKEGEWLDFLESTMKVYI